MQINFFTTFDLPINKNFCFVIFKVKKAMFLGASAIIIITLNQRVLRKVGYGNTHDNLSSTKLLSLLQKLGYNFSLQPFLGVWVDIRNSYDWSMVGKATINQSRVMPFHPNDLRSHYNESL